MKQKHQRSFLKWAGGKLGALDHVFKKVPKRGNHLIEPFVGSATVALNTDYQKYTLCDSNAVLINLFKMVVADPHAVIAALRPLFIPENNQKARYYELKDRFNQSTDLDEKSLLFVYLNRHCYNGLMRFSQKKGEFNTSFGSFKRVYFPEQELLFFAEKFKHAEFIHGCFSQLNLEMANPAEKSVVYCDPPYLKASKTAHFTAYSQEGFDKKDHLSLNDCCARWSQLGYRTFVSNSDVPDLAILYPSRKSTSRFAVQRNISRQGDARGKAAEVLMIYE